MKKAIFVFAVVLAASSAHAAIMGFLASSESVTTVTGKMAWRCTYNVAGRQVSVVVQGMCPSTMNFD